MTGPVNGRCLTDQAVSLQRFPTKRCHHATIGQSGFSLIVSDMKANYC
jgi:hypothetical protein